MAYGMDKLRKAGQALRDFDDAYSNKIANFYESRYEKSGKTQADAMKEGLGMMLGGALPSTRKTGMEVTPNSKGEYNKVEQGLANVLDYALPAESAVVKYVLPAAGVTLAGKGLIDMANVIGQQTSTTLEPN
jgi:hypothetical protein